MPKKKPVRIGDLDNENLMERFYEGWRTLRRGDLINKIVPIFLEASGMPLTTSESDILKEVGRLVSGSMTEIAARAHCDPGNTTRTLTQLDKQGYITRRSRKGEGRTLEVRLTPKGHKAVDLIKRRRKLVYEVAMSELSSKQRYEFMEMLDQVTQSLQLFVTPAVQTLLFSHDNGLSPSAECKNSADETASASTRRKRRM